MMSRMLGAPLGGTMRGGHQVFDPARVSLITPPNFGGGAGSCFPSMEIVALGEPNTPLTTPPAEADAPEPAACAFALPAAQEPPNAAASAAFAVDRNNCRRFIVISSVGLF